MFSIQKLCALALCFWGGFSHAQTTPGRDYPNHPIKMVIPYAAGGPMDFIGRTLAPRLAQSLGQPLLIDNRAGAGGAIGTERHADGHQFLFDFLIRRHREYVWNQYRQTARCREPLIRRVVRNQLLLNQTGEHTSRKNFTKAGERFGRELFGQQLNEQWRMFGLIHHTASF